MPRSESYRDKPSEYGGQKGLVQPPPHVPTAGRILQCEDHGTGHLACRANDYNDKLFR